MKFCKIFSQIFLFQAFRLTYQSNVFYPPPPTLSPYHFGVTKFRVLAKILCEHCVGSFHLISYQGCWNSLGGHNMLRVKVPIERLFILFAVIKPKVCWIVKLDFHGISVGKKNYLALLILSLNITQLDIPVFMVPWLRENPRPICKVYHCRKLVTNGFIQVIGELNSWLLQGH